MKFIVRYWSSILPRERGQAPGETRWQDYSVHPASKLGLHNALLAVHDRLEILAAHGGQFGCAVFAVEGDSVDRLAPEEAARLFAVLPRGEVKWLDIHPCPLATLAAPPASGSAPARPPDARQLPLFAHIHTPYDDLDAAPHRIDIEAA